MTGYSKGMGEMSDDRTARLEKEVASLSVEVNRLKAAIAWRAITPDGAAALEKTLAARAGSVNLRWTDGDPEAMYLAMQLAAIFNKARWQMAPSAFKMGNGLLIGLHIPKTETADWNNLASGLEAARISFSPAEPPANSIVALNPAVIDGAPTLYVGSKAPPNLQPPQGTPTPS
jgi:hypothetical protein